MYIYVGYPNAEFKVLWKETVKQIITSACIVKSSDMIYAGTMKGQIYKFFLNDSGC